MPTPVKVCLSQQQRQLAEKEALRRQTENEKKSLKGRNGGLSLGKKSLDLHILGATGEVAVAYFLGLEPYLFQEIEANRGSPDLPGSIEVKTRSRHSYDLIIQWNEKKDKKAVLVTIEKEDILIHGWCLSGEVMTLENWKDYAGGRPAYFVPKQLLRPAQELLDSLDVREPDLSFSGSIT